jgi:type III restriction enzyme
MRNPNDGFLKIKLLDGRGTENFNPDFIVFKDDEILALDTKGGHLIQIDSARKLFFLEKACKDGKDLTIKLISEKQYNDQKQVINQNGYTVWTIKQGTVAALTCTLISDAVKLCLA